MKTLTSCLSSLFSVNTIPPGTPSRTYYRTWWWLCLVVLAFCPFVGSAQVDPLLEWLPKPPAGRSYSAADLQRIREIQRQIRTQPEFQVTNSGSCSPAEMCPFPFSINTSCQNGGPSIVIEDTPEARSATFLLWVQGPGLESFFDLSFQQLPAVFPNGARGFSGLVAATYLLAATRECADGSLCNAIYQEFTITGPSVTINTYPHDFCPSGKKGTITAAGAGTHTFLQYRLGNGSWQTHSTYATFHNLAAGTYQVQVKDSQGCITQEFATVTTLPTPSLNSVVGEPAPNCQVGGQALGTLLFSGSTPANQPLSYGYAPSGSSSWSWDDAESQPVAPGTYQTAVSYYPSYGCRVLAPTATSVAQGEPPISVAVTNQENPSWCDPNSGSFSLTASGGSGQYRYSIDDGYSWLLAGRMEGLSAGVYAVRVKDAQLANCETTESVTLAGSAAPVIDSVRSTAALCVNTQGTVQIFARGSYTLQYALVPYDNPGATPNWLANPLLNVPPGTYRGLVRYAYTGDGCVREYAQPVTLERRRPQLDSLAVSPPLTCSSTDGQLQVWGTAVSAWTLFPPGSAAPLSSEGAGASWNGLSTGTYHLIASLEEGGISCQWDTTIILSALGSVWDGLLVHAPQQCEDPTDGAIEISLDTTLFQGALSYSIDSGHTWQASPYFAMLEPGIYWPAVQDSLCFLAVPDPVVLVEPQRPAFIVTPQATSDCFTTDGALSLAPAPGTTAEGWLFRVNEGPWQATPTLTGLEAGHYSLAIARPSGACLETVVVVVPRGGNCIMVCPGEQAWIGLPGPEPFCAAWSPQADVADPAKAYTSITPTTNRMYTLLITDDQGNITDSLRVGVGVQAVPPLLVTPTEINRCLDVQQEFTVLNPALFSSLQWKNATGEVVASGTVFAPTTPGIFQLQATDLQGCSVERSLAVVRNQAALGAQALLQVSPTAAALCADSVRLQIPAHFQQVQWFDSNGQLQSQGSELMAHHPDTYTVKAVLGSDCPVENTVVVTAPDFALQMPQDTVLLSCTNLALQLKQTAFAVLPGERVDSLRITAPEGYTIHALWEKGCFDCGELRLSFTDSLHATAACDRWMLRTWEVRDQCGHLATASQWLHFMDDTPPAFADFPEDATLPCAAPLPQLAPLAVDACDAAPRVSLLATAVTDSIGCGRTLIRTWAAQDACGNLTTREQRIVLLDTLQPPVDTLPLFALYACGDSAFVLPPIGNTAPLPAAQEGDVWNIGGFPIGLTQVLGSNGRFSGQGDIPLPFGNKRIRFQFADVQVNADQQITQGQLIAVADAGFFVPTNTGLSLGGEICLPRGNGAATTAPNGSSSDFDEQGNFTRQPPYEGFQPGDPFDPNRDPNGFNAQGIHFSTGTQYNEAGCSQTGVDSLGQPCNPAAKGPYYWLGGPNSPSLEGIALANQYRDKIRAFLLSILQDERQLALARLQQTLLRCDSLRQATNAHFEAAGFQERPLVFGPDNEYLNVGMWRKFTTTPQPLADNVDRLPAAQALEQSHIGLYGCDQALEMAQLALSIIDQLLTEDGLSEMAQQMLDLLQRVSPDEATALESETGFLNWLQKHVSANVANRLAYAVNQQIFGWKGVVPYQMPATAYGAAPLSTTTFDETAAALANAWLAEIQQAEAEQQQWRDWLSGAEWVGTIHRAFYLEELLQQRRQQWFVTPPANQPPRENILPIEIKKEIGGQTYTILIDQVRLGPQGGTCNAYLILDIPTSGDRVVFRALDIPFSPAGPTSNAALTLASDVEVRLSNAALLRIKGNENSFVSWDCEGFAGMNIDAEIEFCRDILIPLHPETLELSADPAQRVTAHFSAGMPSWGDFQAAISMDPFAIASATDFRWVVQDALLDFSDLTTPPQVRFPSNYGADNPQFAPAQWRGFYLGQLTVRLPQALTGQEGGLTVGVQDFIIDDRGVTGMALFSPLLSLDQGNLGGWAFSIDTFALQVVANQLSGGGLAGLIHVPIFGGDGEAITPQDCFRYRAVATPTGFDFVIQPRTAMRVDMWQAQVDLDPASHVQAVLQQGSFLARATLHGTVRIDGDLKPGLSINIPPIRFSNLQLANQAPYFNPGKWELPAALAAKLGPFSLDIHELGVRSGAAAGEADLALGVKVQLDDALKIGAAGGFRLRGQLVEVAQRQRWRAIGVAIDEFAVLAEFSGNRISGMVSFFEENPVYGAGFRGMVNARFASLGFEVSALAQFGRVDSNRYFLVDALAELNQPLGGPLQIKGFGGGVYKGMKRQAGSLSPAAMLAGTALLPALGESLSGIVYTPHPGAGLGLKATVLLAVVQEELFNATATLEVAFNTSGGLDEVAIYGLARLMAKPDLQAPPVEDINGSPLLVIPDLRGMAAFVQIALNFEKHTLDATAAVYMYIPGNLLTGTGADGALGEVHLHFSPEKWFINVGTPTNRVGLQLQIPGLPAGQQFVQAGAYFTAGTAIPPMPPLPAYARQITGAGNFMQGESSRATGNGFAFGADLSLHTGELGFLIFYASLDAGLGFDVMLQQYAGATCGGSGNELGINGWYASGQAWAFINAEVGIRLKKKGRGFPIGSIGAGVALQTKLPNPFWAQGAFGGRYSILGGLVKGRFNFKFTLGESCDLQSADGQPIPELTVITALRPEDRTSGVSVLTNLNAEFSTPIGHEINLFDDNGNPVRYRVKLDSITLRTSTGISLPGRRVWSADVRNLRFEPYEALPSNDSLRFRVQVSFYQDDQWIQSEAQEVAFFTGSTPSVIPAQNVAASYPLAGMQAFYPQEVAGGQGFIQLVVGQGELLNAAQQPTLTLLQGGTEMARFPVTYSAADRRLAFTLDPALLLPQTDYVLQLSSVPTGADSAPAILLSLPFRTSAYSRFREKLQAFLQGATLQRRGTAISLQQSSAEPFDILETAGAPGQPPLLALQASLLGNPWFETQMAAFYQSGTPCMPAFFPTQRSLADDEEIVPEASVAIDADGHTIHYRAFSTMATDWTDRQAQARLLQAEKIAGCQAGEPLEGIGQIDCPSCDIDADLRYFLNLAFPMPSTGDFDVRASYAIPGFGTTTFTSFPIRLTPNNY